MQTPLPPFSRRCLALALAAYLITAWVPCEVPIGWRLFSALLGWGATWRLVRGCESWFTDERLRRVAVAATALTWYLPFLWADYSAPSWGGAFFFLGFPTLVECVQFKRGPGRALFWLAGLAMGVGAMVDCAVGIMALSALLWFLRYGHKRLQAVGWCALGIGTACAAFFLLDRAGVTGWIFPPRITWPFYLMAGIREVPRWLRFVDITPRVALPLGVALGVGTVMAWIRKPRFSLTWVTLPYFVTDFFLGHQELRTLAPLAPAVPVLAMMALTTSPKLVQGLFYRRSGKAVIGLIAALNAVAWVWGFWS